MSRRGNPSLFGTAVGLPGLIVGLPFPEDCLSARVRICKQQLHFRVLVTRTEDELHIGGFRYRLHAALSTFRHFMAEYPGHEKAIEAEFMVGCCLEELQQIGPAISIFQKIEDRYPVPGAVKIRRLRLEGRKHSTPKEQ